MIISREGIASDQITNFSVEERFLKIPVENFLKEEGITPNPPQYAMLNAINDPKYRFIVGCIGRRVGKSYISFTVAFLKALEPNTKVLLISADYSLASLGYDHLGKLINKYNLETDKFNAKDREIYLTNGSMIKVASVGRADSAVGRSYDLIINTKVMTKPL